MEHAEIHKALFGDPTTNELGIVQMNQEMYKAWSALILFGKAVTAIAVFFAAIGTAWATFGKGVFAIVKKFHS